MRAIIGALLIAGCGGEVSDAGDASADGSYADGHGNLDGPKNDGKPPPPFDAAACVPGDVSTWKPTWHPPNTPSGACTPALVDDYVSMCFSSSSGCSAYKAANPACAQCMESSVTDPTYGPLVIDTNDGLASPNVSGCVALTLKDTSSTGCGAQVQAAQQCGLAACVPNCQVPPTDQVSFAAFSQCLDTAAQGPCAAYEKAATCESQQTYCKAATPAQSLSVYGRLFCAQ